MIFKDEEANLRMDSWQRTHGGRLRHGIVARVVSPPTHLVFRAMRVYELPSTAIDSTIIDGFIPERVMMCRHQPGG